MQQDIVNLDNATIHIRKNKQEKAGSQSYGAPSHCQFTYKTLRVAEKSIMQIYSIDCMERKKSEQI